MALKSKGYLCGTRNFPISFTDSGVGPCPHLGKIIFVNLQEKSSLS